MAKVLIWNSLFVFKCYLDPVLRPWLEAGQSPFLEQLISPHQFLPYGALTLQDHCALALIALGPGTSQLGTVPRCWSPLKLFKLTDP